MMETAAVRLPRMRCWADKRERDRTVVTAARREPPVSCSWRGVAGASISRRFADC